MCKLTTQTVEIVVVNLVVVRREIHYCDKPAHASTNRIMNFAVVHGPMIIKILNLALGAYALYTKISF